MYNRDDDAFQSYPALSFNEALCNHIGYANEYCPNCLVDEQVSVSPTGGLRYNTQKTKPSMVPTSLKKAVAAVLWKSAKENGGKYPMNNWKKGLSWVDTMDSLERHLDAFKDGEDLDPESGLPHAYHIATNAAFLVEYFDKHKNLDDRYKP